MKYAQTVASLIACSTLLVALPGCIIYVDDHGDSYGPLESPRIKLTVTTTCGSDQPVSAGPIAIGTWTADGNFVAPPADEMSMYRLMFRVDSDNGNSNTIETRTMVDIEGLPVSDTSNPGPISFQIRRDAGLMLFDGERAGHHASGTARFQPDMGYASALGGVAGRDVTALETYSLALRNVTRAEIEDFRASGLTISPQDIVRLRNQGVSATYLKEINAAGGSGGSAFTIDEAIRLRNSGVSAKYIAEMRDAGYAFDAENLIRLRNSGVSASMAAGLAQPGQAPLDSAEIIRIRNSGVRTQMFNDLHDAGYNFSTDEVIRLGNHGVSASYAKDIKAAGYDPGVDDLIRLRNSGVSAQYVKDLQEPGYERAPIDTIIDARNRGLSADFVKKLRKRE